MAQAVRGHHAYVSNAEASPAGPPYRRNMFFYIGKRFRQNRGMHGNNPCKGCTSPTSIAGGHWRLATDWPLQRRPHRQCSLRLRTSCRLQHIQGGDARSAGPWWLRTRARPPARGENGDRMQNTGQTTARVVQTWTATRGARRISRRVSWDGVTKRSSRLERASCARHACHAGRRVAAPSTRSRSGGARLLRLRRPGCHTTRHTPGAGAEERSGR